MVSESRALYSDLANRRHFTEEKKPISDTRRIMAELSAPDELNEEELQERVSASASNLKHAADSGFVEMG